MSEVVIVVRRAWRINISIARLPNLFFLEGLMQIGHLYDLMIAIFDIINSKGGSYCLG